MKRWALSLLILFLIFAVSIINKTVHSWDVNIIQLYPDSGIVKLNGEVVPTASKPIIFNNRLYVPIRTISNMIGATITWNATQRYATMYVPNFLSMMEEIQQKDNEINALKHQLESTGIFGDVLRLLKKDYLYKDSFSDRGFTYSAIKGALSTMGDKYTRFFTPGEVRMRKALLSKGAFTIGVHLTRSSGKYIVLDVIQNSPAYYAGLMPGDVLKSIDGVYIRDLPYDDVKMLMSATTTKEITVDIVRNGTPMTLNIYTNSVADKDFSYSIISVDGKKVAYLRIISMQDDVVSEMESALKQIFFTVHGEASAYILDLRGNFGGNIDVTRRLLGFFLGGKKVYTLIDGDGNETPMYAPVSQWMISTGKPIYILIDEGTTSAAEVFALAMKSYGRAILVGQTTYGKGVASLVYELSDGSMLVFTAYEVKGPHGEALNGFGVLPDVWSMTLYAKEQAISLFKQGILHPSDLGR